MNTNLTGPVAQISYGPILKRETTLLRLCWRLFYSSMTDPLLCFLRILPRVLLSTITSGMSTWVSLWDASTSRRLPAVCAESSQRPADTVWRGSFYQTTFARVNVPYISILTLNMRLLLQPRMNHVLTPLVTLTCTLCSWQHPLFILYVGVLDILFKMAESNGQFCSILWWRFSHAITTNAVPDVRAIGPESPNDSGFCKKTIWSFVILNRSKAMFKE